MVGVGVVLVEGLDAAPRVVELDGHDVVAAEDLLPDLPDVPALGKVLAGLRLGHVLPVLEGADRPGQHLVVGGDPVDLARE